MSANVWHLLIGALYLDWHEKNREFGWSLCALCQSLTAVLPSFLFGSKPLSEMSISGLCFCLHICSATSLCCFWRIQKGTPMNNLCKAGICKEVNRHKKQNANNHSSLHDLITRECPVFCLLELSVLSDQVRVGGHGGFLYRATKWSWACWWGIIIALQFYALESRFKRKLHCFTLFFSQNLHHRSNFKFAC